MTDEKFKEVKEKFENLINYEIDEKAAILHVRGLCYKILRENDYDLVTSYTDLCHIRIDRFAHSEVINIFKDVYKKTIHSHRSVEKPLGTFEISELKDAVMPSIEPLDSITIRNSLMSRLETYDADAGASLFTKMTEALAIKNEELLKIMKIKLFSIMFFIPELRDISMMSYEDYRKWYESKSDDLEKILTYTEFIKIKEWCLND